MIEPRYYWTQILNPPKRMVWPGFEPQQEVSFFPSISKKECKVGSIIKWWSPVHIPHPPRPSLPCRSFLGLNVREANSWIEWRVSHKIWDASSLILHPSTYIQGQILWRRIRPAMFPVNLWNHYEDATNKAPKTTHCAEVWHNSLRALFQASHPSIWTLLQGLWNGIAHTEIDSRECRSGQQWQTQGQIQGVSRQTEWKS